MMDETRITKMEDNGDLMDIVRLTALNVNGISEQMGVIVKTVSNFKSDLVEVKGDVKDIGERVRVIEEDEPLKAYQQYNYSQAVRIRVTDLLEIEFDERGGVIEESMETYTRYYSKFCGRLHLDAKHAGIEASNWRFTPRKNYPQLMQFAPNWCPSRGVEGLKEYYDKLEKSHKCNRK